MRNLAARVAAQRKEDSGDDPISWWCKTTGAEANYSDLLESLAHTPPARQAILREYFEPSEEERDQGLKLPTRGHRAIARLVKSGPSVPMYVRH